jgi:quinol-cytochrome oxidoreductase complex cytochrome b subunit
VLVLARGLARRAWEWLYERAGIEHIPFYRVPYTYFNLDLWLGAIVAASFFWLAITGLLLLFYYNPSEPLESTKATIFERPFGALILTSHLYAAHFMLIGVFLHAFRNLFKGAYKRPRELVWILGVLTGFLALQTAFFGYSLAGDRIAEEAINIGRALNLRGLGETIGLYVINALFTLDPEQQYYRLLAIHVLSATLLFLLFALHFGLFEMHGPTPREDETKWRVEPSKIPQDRPDLAPWFPVNLVFILAVTFSVWGLIVFVAGLAQRYAEMLPPLFSPYPVEAEDFVPRPPWFFLYAYRIFQFTFLTLPVESVPQLLQLIVSMVLPPLILIAIPFIDRAASRHPLDRPLITLIGMLMLVYFFQLTFWGLIEAGKPFGLNETLVALAPPFFLATGGLYLLLRAWRGQTIELGRLLAVAGYVAAGSILPLLIAIARGLTGLGEEMMTGLLGFAMTMVLLGWIAAKMRVEEPPKVVENKDPDEAIPGYLLLVGIFEFAVAVFSTVALVAIALIDPVAFAVEATVLTGLLLLAAGGLAHLVFRALVAEKLPPGDFVSEIKPHLIPILAVILAFILVF